MRNFVLFIATGAGSGYSPIISGTAGSAVGIALWVVCVPLLAIPQLPYLVGLAALILLGIWAAGEAEKLFERHDDGRIVIDEVVGQLVALLWLPVSPLVALTGFVLFRIFDIWKPPPVRAFEALPGGLGVVADDLMAGVYANLVGQLLWRLIWPEAG